MPIPGLETVEPDGAMPWPLTLIEGEEHSGKTWDVVTFLKQCDQLGEAYWIPLDESGHARMYGGRLPGKPFEIVKLKKGDYNEVLDVVRKVKAHAATQHAAGEKPVALVIDTISGIWSGLHDWVNARHRDSRGAKKILEHDPNADVGRAGRNLWNDADDRWRALVRELKTFPGLVIVTARGKEISATDPLTGQPAVDERKKPIKTWAMETKRGFEYYVDVHLRKRREEGAFVVGVRSVEHGKKPGSPEAKEAEPILADDAEGRELEWLLFDILGLDPKTAYVNDFTEFDAGGFTEGELARMETENRDAHQQERAGARKPTIKQAVAKIEAIKDPAEELTEVWRSLNRFGMLKVDSGVEAYTLEELLRGKKEKLLELARREAQGGSATPARNADAGKVAASWATDNPEEETAPPAEPGEATGAVLAKAAGKGKPATGREKSTTEPEAVSQSPDEPDMCRDSPVRRGVINSLVELRTQEQVEAHFGRPIEQVATKKLRDYNGRVIAEGRNAAQGEGNAA